MFARANRGERRRTALAFLRRWRIRPVSSRRILRNRRGFVPIAAASSAARRRASIFNPKPLCDIFYTEAVGQGTPGAYTQPHADNGTINGTGIVWDTASLPPNRTSYLSCTANSGRVQHTGFHFQSVNFQGQNEAQVGPAYTVEIALRAHGGSWASADRSIWTDGTGNTGFWMVSGVPKLYVGGYHGPSGALPTSGLVVVHFVIDADLTAYWYVNGSLVMTDTYFQGAGWGNWTLKDMLGTRVSSTSYPYQGDCFGIRVYDFALNAAEISTRQNLTELADKPVFRYDMQDGSGTTVTDLTEVLGTGSLVATVANQVGTNLTASGAERGIFVSSSVQPVDRNPAFLPALLRLNTATAQASATGLVGDVDDLCGMFGLRVSSSLDASHQVAGVHDAPLAVWGASSSSGAGAYGTSTSVAWILLSWRYPAHETKNVPSEWEVLVKPLGTATIQRVHGSLATGLMVRVGFQYHGGATAGSRYLKVWVNGVSSGSMVLTGASVPQTLNLSGGTFTICPEDGTTVYRAGIDLDAGGVGNSQWSDAQMSSFDGWIKQRSTCYQDVTYQELFGSGQIFPSDNYSFNLGPYLGANGLTSGLIAVTTQGNGDPAANFKVSRRLSTDLGATWGSELDLFDLNGSADPGSYCISNPLYCANSAKLIVLMSTSPVVGYPWYSYVALSSNNGTSFGAATLMVVSGLPSQYTYNPGTVLGYWSPAGTVVELADGKIWALCEGWYSTSGTDNTLGKLRLFLIEWDPVADPTGVNWTFKIDISAAAGTTGTGSDLAEPAMVAVSGSGASTHWVLAARQNGGGSTKVIRSTDNAATWGPFLTLGDGTLGQNLTETAMWYGASDPQTRLWLQQPCRSKFEQNPPTGPTWAPTRSPGLSLVWSTTQGARWRHIAQILMGAKGWWYGMGLDDGQGNMLLSGCSEWLKGIVVKVPYQALIFPGSET